MKNLYARDLLSMTDEEVWDLPDETFILVFDDGEIVTNTRRTIYSWYHWEMLRCYPDTKVRVRHHMGNGVFSDKTSLDILSHLFEDVHHTYGDGHYDREGIWKLIYETINLIYNVFIVKIAAYQTTSNILDYLEIYDHPAVTAANDNLKPTQVSFDATYDQISKTVHTAPELRHNPVVRACRSGLVKQGQVNQIVGPRGFMTDADSQLFSMPLMTGYLEGVTSLYGSLIESRSAVKALIFTKNPLQVVEYFNRKMQLSSSYVKDLIPGDCGSNEYVEVMMEVDMLRGFEGKYYLDEQTNQLKPITLKSQDLHQRLIKVRSATKCRHRAAAAVCYTCMGQLAYQVPYRTNLGHVSSSEMCHEASQLVLSVKHYDGSSVVMPLSLSEHDAQFIYEGTSPGKIYLLDSLKNKHAYFILDAVERPPVSGASGLASIKPTTDVRTLLTTSITRFKNVQVGIVTPQGEILENYVSVSQGSRLGSFTYDFLEYVQTVGFTIADDGSYRVDLAHWDYAKPVFELPLKHRNMLDYMADIEVFIRSPQDTGRDARTQIGVLKLIDYTSIDKALLDLYEMVSSKLSVNVAHLEVLMTSMMRGARDPDDYGIPDLDEPVVFERHRRLMEMRCLGGAMAYERQPTILESVDSFLIRDRMRHIMAPMLM